MSAPALDYDVKADFERLIREDDPALLGKPLRRI